MFIFILPSSKNLGIKVKINDQVQFTIKTGFENSGTQAAWRENIERQGLGGSVLSSPT